MAENSKLENALALAAKGYRVFPLAPGSKKPPRDFHWKRAATVIPAEVKKLWFAYPGANIGVATGNGMLVIDVDVKGGRSGDESLALLDALGLDGDSFRVSTPSGGTHIYLNTELEHGQRVDTVDGFPGIDIRCDGGYVVGPGSEVDGKTYSITNDVPLVSAPWFDEILLKGNGARAAKTETPLIELDQQANIDRAREYLLNRAPEAIEGAGGDDTTYRVATRCRDYGLSEGVTLDLMLEHWNEQKASPPWMPDELEAKVSNAFQYASGSWGGQTAEAEFGALDIDVGESPMKSEVEIPAAEAPAHRKRRLAAVRCGDALEAALAESPPPLIDGLLDLGTFAVIYGPPNSGKTFAALDMCAAVATGRPWIGRKVDKGPVLYVFAEGGRRIIDRLAALQKMERLPTGAPFFRISSAVNLYSKEDVAAIIAEASAISGEGAPLRLIVLDTLARVMQGGDENSGQDMAAAVAAVDRIREATGATVLVVHHTGKDASRGMRGHSALLAAIDTEIVLERKPREKIGRLRTGKQRDLPSDVEFRFALESVLLGVTPSGERRSSCVFKPVDDLAIDALPLSPGAEAYLETLREAGGPLTVAGWNDAHRRGARPNWREGDKAPEGRSDVTLRRYRKELKDDQHIREVKRDTWEAIFSE